MIVALALFTALVSGLNLGIISLEPSYLELLTMGPFQTKEDERDAQYAAKILPLRRKTNLLLCTIILSNVAAASLLSIMLADITSGLIGTIVSTLVIMLFGEILP